MDFDHTIKIKTPGSGMMVFNRYRLDRVLGRGGMGVVWLADDEKLERLVALKFLPSLIGLDPAAVKELKTETRRGLELSHPNIVRIYDFVDDDDAAAISMEFVDGRTLSEMRMSVPNGVFSAQDISKWLPGVCDALDYAHFQCKVVHRDLKPANIMVTTKDEVAKIADFGIARSLSDTMSRLSAAHIGTSGTLPYMSPQQAMGERPGPTDDVYSLGATIYELLSGKPPFYRGDLPTQINSKIPPAMNDRRVELEIQTNEAVPKEWEAAIAACLNKDPALRPASAGTLASMLGLKAGSITSRTSVTFSGTSTASPTHAAGFSAPTMATQREAADKSQMIKWAAAAAAVVIVGGGAWYLTRPEPPIVTPAPVAQKEVEVSSPAAPEAAAPSATKAAPVAAVNPVPAESDNGDIAVVTGGKPAMAASSEPMTAVTPGATSPAPAPTTTMAVAPTMPASGGFVPATPPATAPASPQVSPAAGTSTVATNMGVPSANTAGVAPASPAAPETAANVGVMPAEPGAAPATSPATPNPTPAPTVDPAAQFAALPPGTILPAGTTLPPGVVLPTGVTIAAAPPSFGDQPTVTEPTTGFWPLNELYQSTPFSGYSDSGKRWVLYRAQSVLKEKGFYESTIDGKEGKGTHKAIQNFQLGNQLKPTGLLDGPTLTAMNLTTEVDKLEWEAPAQKSTSSSSSRSRSRKPKEEPNWWQRTIRRFGS